jgi:hypothetical protein
MLLWSILSKCRPYRTSPAAKQEIQKQMDEMLKNDIIEHSKSEYSFPKHSYFDLKIELKFFVVVHLNLNYLSQI